MNDLASKHCEPCMGGVPPLEKSEISVLLKKLGNDWKVIDDHHIEKDYTFENFRAALDFTNQIGELAEDVNHHPDILLRWGGVKVMLWTHKIDGLAHADFIFAAKVEELFKQR